MLLGYPFGEGLKRLPAIGRAIDDHPAFGGNPLLIFHRRHEPGRVRITRMHGDSEPEDRRLDVLDLAPACRTVVGFEDAIMMLDPERVGSSRALHKQMRVLNVGVVSTLLRHVLSAHAFAATAPGFTTVPREP